jgi:hypothetical protein
MVRFGKCRPAQPPRRPWGRRAPARPRDTLMPSWSSALLGHLRRHALLYSFSPYPPALFRASRHHRACRPPIAGVPPDSP